MTITGKLFDTTGKLPQSLRGGVVAIGNFDGVHQGHHAVLDEALKIARKEGIPAVVLTFEPHPRTWFRPESPVFRLTPSDLKAELLLEAGFDCVVLQPFDAEFSSQTAEEFVNRHLVADLGAAHVVTGYDFHFGKGRQGTPEFLREAGKSNGFGVTQVAAHTDRPDAGEKGEVISSSRIRAALGEGDIKLANELLGYKWRVKGVVRDGAKLGRTLGFPTANLKLPEETGLRHGIYAVRMIRENGDVHDGVASFGRRPTFDNGAPLLETFVFDFDQNLYEENIEIEFAGWIRPEEKFDSVEDLVEQMHRDSATAEQILASNT